MRTIGSIGIFNPKLCYNCCNDDITNKNAGIGTGVSSKICLVINEYAFSDFLFLENINSLDIAKKNIQPNRDPKSNLDLF
jgi:hypothetical protein